MSRSLSPYSGHIVDANVHKLVTSWLDIFPDSLNMSLKNFLRMGHVSNVMSYGPVFARKHQHLIRTILDNYADSVSLVHVPEDQDDDENRCNAFIESEYDEDPRHNALLEEDYEEDPRPYFFRKDLSVGKLANQRM